MISLEKDRKIYQTKYVISGNVVEQYSYEKNQFKGFDGHNEGGKNRGGIEPSENRSKSLNRARKTVIRAINSNPCLDKFLTLTFEENITDLDYSNKELKDFIRRVNYQVFKTKKCVMKYVAVIEFQKRGAVHYHMLCNLPYVDVNALAEIWGHGFVKLNKIKGDKNRFGSDECDNVGAYVCKYMTKDNDDSRLKERKSYLMSRNLDKPKEIYININEKDVLADVYDLEHPLLAHMHHQSHLSGVYTNDFTGNVIYNQYNLKRLKNQSK